MFFYESAISIHFCYRQYNAPENLSPNLFILYFIDKLYFHSPYTFIKSFYLNLNFTLFTNITIQVPNRSLVMESDTQKKMNLYPSPL